MHCTKIHSAVISFVLLVIISFLVGSYDLSTHILNDCFTCPSAKNRPATNHNKTKQSASRVHNLGAEMYNIYTKLTDTKVAKTTFMLSLRLWYL